MKTGLALNDPPVRLGERRARIQDPQRKSLIREDMPLAAPAVSIQGYQYLVDLGLGFTPRYHRVSKNKTCSCGAPDCEAVEAVRQYLQSGGIRAPDLQLPPPCPICGGKTFRDPIWDGKYTRELGWRCEKGGLHHFLEARTERIRLQQAENPWLIPPMPDRPGVRRDELMSWEECAAISRKVFLETGYDPTA